MSSFNDDNECKLIHNEEKEGSKPDKNEEKSFFMTCLEGAGISFSVATSLWSSFQEITTSNVLLGRLDELTSRIEAVKFEKRLISGNIEAVKETASKLRGLANKLETMQNKERESFWARAYARLYHYSEFENNCEATDMDVNNAIDIDVDNILKKKYENIFSEIDILETNIDQQTQQNEELLKQLQTEKLNKRNEIKNLVLKKGFFDGINIVVNLLILYKQYNDLVKDEEIKKEAFEELENINKKYVKPIINSINDNKEINEKLIYKAKYKLNKLKRRAKKHIKKNRDIMISSGVNLLRTVVDVSVNTWSFFNKSSVLPGGYKWLLGGIIAGQSVVLGGNCYIFKLAYDKKCDWEKFNNIVSNALTCVKELEIKCKEKGIIVDLKGEISDSEDEENEFKNLLTEWKLRRYIDSFDEEGYMEVDLWEKIDANILRDVIGMKKGHIQVFLKHRDEHFNKMNL